MPMFRNMAMYQAFTQQLAALEGLVEECVDAGASVDGAGEMLDDLLDSYTICRYRTCSFCDGVLCEEAIETTVSYSPRLLAVFRGYCTRVRKTLVAARAYSAEDLGIMPR